MKLVFTILLVSVIAGCAEKNSGSSNADVKASDTVAKQALDAQTDTDVASVAKDTSQPTDLPVPVTDVDESKDSSDLTKDIVSIEETIDVSESPEDTGPVLDAVDSVSDAVSSADASDIAQTLDGGNDTWDAVAKDSLFPDVLTESDTTPADTGNGQCKACVPSEISAVHAMPEQSLVLDASRTAHNPLKGFMTSYSWGKPANDFPDQMEFLYVSMAALWGPNGALFETGLEPHLVAAAERGHHVVVRVYIDYPQKPYGLPSYLKDKVTCQTYMDHGGGCSPNYDHPLLVEAMVALINALGQAYDGDPRLGVVQVGLLGFWGEWHTYPHTSWFPTSDTQKAVLEAFHNAFKVTQLQVRRPAANSLKLRIGFHDDSFAYSTLGDVGWFFWPSLVAAGGAERWKEVMIGGELRPELQGICFEEGYKLGTNAQDVSQCIDTTHASYLLNYNAFNEQGVGYQGEERKKAEKVAIDMGYQFDLKAAKLKLWGLSQNTVNAEVSVTLAQTGVAPFYYAVNASLQAPGNKKSYKNDENLNTLLPGQTRVLKFALGNVPVSLVNAPLALHLNSPILLKSQRILLATQTPGTPADGETRLSWALGCQVGTDMLALGAIKGQLAPNCPCICDVDGQLRTCDGSLCL